MYGNMYLLTELYIAKLLNGNIIKTCLEDLQQEINDQNIEIMCYMINKLMMDLIKQARFDMKNNTVHLNLKYSNNASNKKGRKTLSLDFAD